MGLQMAPEIITIEHGLHTLVQGTVNHCPNRLTGLITQLEKKGWNVQLKEIDDMEMVKVNICDQTVYRCKDFLKRADLNTRRARPARQRSSIKIRGCHATNGTLIYFFIPVYF